jgi:hypothetical protein
MMAFASPRMQQADAFLAREAGVGLDRALMTVNQRAILYQKQRTNRSRLAGRRHHRERNGEKGDFQDSGERRKRHGRLLMIEAEQ